MSKVIKRRIFTPEIKDSQPCPNHFAKLREVKAITERIDRTNNLPVSDKIKSQFQAIDFKAIDKAIRSSCYSCNGRDCHE